MIPTDIHTGVTPQEAEELARLAKGHHVLECGAWFGFSTIVMAAVARSVTSVDWHHGDEHAGLVDTQEQFERNLTRYGVRDRVEVIVGRFEDELPKLPQRRFAGAFLDGKHDLVSVSRDLRLIEPLINRAGCFLAIHDYGYVDPNHDDFEVAEAVHLWLAERPHWKRESVVGKLLVLRQ